MLFGRPHSSLSKIYSPERKAEFLIANAIDPEDRKAAEATARKLGVKSPKHTLRPAPEALTLASRVQTPGAFLRSR